MSGETEDGCAGPAGPLDEVTAAYDGATGSVAAARDLVTAFLGGLRDAPHGASVPPGAVVDACLVVSELVTNAVKYAPAPCVVRLRRLPAALEISVLDHSPVLPTPRAPDGERVGQHGLEIVLALCGSIEVGHEPGGKRVTARVALGEARS